MAAPVVEVRNLKKVFVLPLTRKRVTAIDDLSFNVEEGHIVGFLGANGAGKTTTIKTIMRLIFADAGQVKIFGEDNANIELKRKIGFLTERPYFYDYLTGREFLTFCAQLYGGTADVKQVDTFLEEVGLMHAADRPLRRYSKGMLQRVGIAQALINNPKLLILDEPMSGLDPDGRAEMAKIIERSHKRGATVLFSTHILSDVETLCDRVIMINKGKLVMESSVPALLAQHTAGFLVEIRTAKSQFRDIEKKNLRTEDEVQKAVSEAVSKGDHIVRVEPARPSLEEIFVKLKKESS